MILEWNTWSVYAVSVVTVAMQSAVYFQKCYVHNTVAHESPHHFLHKIKIG